LSVETDIQLFRVDKSVVGTVAAPITIRLSANVLTTLSAMSYSIQFR